jgi:hypothetical protein
MKLLTRITLFLSIISFAGILVSCEPDTSTTNDPNDPRNAYVGVWQFTEIGMKSGKSITQSYIVSISLDPDNSSQVMLNNFGNPGVSERDVFGLVTTNQLVVSPQILENEWTVEGSGKLIGTDKMTWTYAITAGGDKIYYSATASKQ